MFPERTSLMRVSSLATWKGDLVAKCVDTAP